MSKTYPVVRLNILNETIVFADQAVIEAETTQEIHPIGIEVPASAARLRLWLDDTKNDEILVSDSNSYSDGTYYRDGDRNGRPSYSRIKWGINWVAGAWYITLFDVGDEDDTYITTHSDFKSYDDVATPDFCTTWELAGQGNYPLPKVTRVVYQSLREKFSPFGDGEYYQAMAEGLVVDVSESIDGVEKFIGRFYAEEWNCPREGELEIVCTDLLGTMENKNYLGSFYESPTPASAIIADIMSYIGIGYNLDSAVGEKLLKGYIPGNISLRAALQQVLFAAGAYASTSGSNRLSIKPSVIPASADAGDLTITEGEMTDTRKLKLQQKVTGVSIMSHDYYKGEGTVEEIFSQYLEPGDYFIVYPKPYWEVQVEGTGDTITYLANTAGEVIVSPDSGAYPDCVIYTTFGEFVFGTNHTFLHVPNPGGHSRITGKPWHEATQRFEWSAEDADNMRVNVWKIDGATLVPALGTAGMVTAPEVLARVVSYAQLRYQQEITLFPHTEIDLGKMAVVDSLWGKDVIGIVEKLSSNLTGGYLIDTEIIGVEHTPEG